MPKRSSKTEDVNEAAFRILAESVGTAKAGRSAVSAAAAALGRLGGLEKGGKRRAESLSQKRRKEIAQLAARARWVKAGREG